MRITLSLMLLCLVFLGILVQEIRHPPALAFPKPRPAQRDLPPLPRFAFSLPPLAHYREIVERPLFFPERKPPEAQPVAIAPPRPPGKLAVALTGIVITPEKRQALVKDLKTQEVSRLEEGMSIQGWKVVKIEPEKVIFEQRGGREVLILYRYEPPPSRPKALPKRRNLPRGRLKRPGTGLK